MSEETLRKFLADSEVENQSFSSTDEAWAFLHRFVEKLGEDAAEITYLSGSGRLPGEIARIYDSNWTRVLEHTAAVFDRNEISEDQKQIALNEVERAFRRRLASLARARRQGGRA